VILAGAVLLSIAEIDSSWFSLVEADNSNFAITLGLRGIELSGDDSSLAYSMIAPYLNDSSWSNFW